MDLAKLKRQRAELDALIAEAEKAAKVEKKVAKRAPAAAKKVTETMLPNERELNSRMHISGWRARKLNVQPARRPRKCNRLRA